MSVLQNIHDTLAAVKPVVGVAAQANGQYSIEFADGTQRQATAAEISAAELAFAAKTTAKSEDAARATQAKQAYAQLQTIIDGIDAATLAQAKTAIKQLAQIEQHMIRAVLGR